MHIEINHDTLSISFATLTPISDSLSWLIFVSKSRTNLWNTSTRYGRASGRSKNSESFFVSWCHNLVVHLQTIRNAWQLINEGKSTNFRVYNVRNDSIYGCNSGGVPASALAIKSSKTSLGGSGIDTASGDGILAKYFQATYGRVALQLFMFGVPNMAKPVRVVRTIEWV